MQKQRGILSRSLSVALLMAITLAPFFTASSVDAAQITNRSLTLQAGTTDGGSKPSGVVNHLFNFTVPSGTTVGSIKFEYCTTASGAVCTVPTGLATDNPATALGSQAGATGFTLNKTTPGKPYLTRNPVVVSGAPAVLTYQLASITNPGPAPQTFYVRISTYASTDTTGAVTDAGTVAASTANQLDISGTMPESLVFCAAEEITTTVGVPDCASAVDGTIEFNQLFSPTDTATATSKMAASTNAGSGYAITVNGPTLTSGSNTIDPMSTSGLGTRGVSQFGMNLKLNTTLTSTTPVGLEVAVPSNGLNYRAQATTGYNTVDSFKYATGDVVADSASGGPGGSDAQILTASYIVNVPGSQPAGTYATTLTYIATPTF